MPNFAFFIHVKITRGVGEVFELSSSLQAEDFPSDTLLHFETRARQRQLGSKIEAKFRTF